MDSFIENPETGEFYPVAYVYRGDEDRIGIPGDQFRNDSRHIVHARTFSAPMARALLTVIDGFEFMTRLSGTADLGKRGLESIQKAFQ